jgi:hypothetical protein
MFTAGSRYQAVAVKTRLTRLSVWEIANPPIVASKIVTVLIY